MCWKLSSNLPDYDGSIAVSWRGQLATDVSLFCKCHSTAWFPPALHNSCSNGCFLHHLHCRTSTMAQVPTLVAKSLFKAMRLPLSKMKTVFWSSCNYLETTLSSICIYRCQDHTANNGWLCAGYEDRVGLFYLYYWPSWTIIMVHCNDGESVSSLSLHGCLPPLDLLLQLISSATVKEHKQARVVRGFCAKSWSTCKAQTESESAGPIQNILRIGI